MKCLLILALGLVLGQAVCGSQRPIKCYVCDSYSDPGCAAPFNNMTYNLMTCPEGYTRCSVTLAKAKRPFIQCPVDRYIRGCADWGRTLSSTSCQMYGKSVKKCYCDDDGCNQRYEI